MRAIDTSMTERVCIYIDVHAAHVQESTLIASMCFIRQLTAGEYYIEGMEM